jgi:hypothetical protein
MPDITTLMVNDASGAHPSAYCKITVTGDADV